MHGYPHTRCAAAFAALMALAQPALAAAPDTLRADEVQAPQITRALDYSLDTEIVVRNWVLCISQPYAEQLARAREAGTQSAQTAYDELAGARSCGKFPELRVILQQRIYSSAQDSGYDARVFGALVNLSGEWASVFVVSDVLTEE